MLLLFTLPTPHLDKQYSSQNSSMHKSQAHITYHSMRHTTQAPCFQTFTVPTSLTRDSPKLSPIYHPSPISQTIYTLTTIHCPHFSVNSNPVTTLLVLNTTHTKQHSPLPQPLFLTMPIRHASSTHTPSIPLTHDWRCCHPRCESVNSLTSSDHFIRFYSHANGAFIRAPAYYGHPCTGCKHPACATCCFLRVYRVDGTSEVTSVGERAPWESIGFWDGKSVSGFLL